MNSIEQDIILIAGKPGSGKSRLGREMTTALGKYGQSVEHISFGDHIRKIGSGAVASEFREQILSHLNEHPYGLLDDEVIAGILERELARSAATALLFIDGMPRRDTQVSILDTLSGDRSIRGMIITDVNDHAAALRLQKRAHRSERNPVNSDTIQLRLQVHNQTFPAVKKAYEVVGLPIEVIDTSGDKDITTQNGLMAVSWMMTETEDNQQKNAS
ncbi:MAG: nucleoside monophosphate kinase [Candidatus Saccharimonadales bacterium]